MPQGRRKASQHAKTRAPPLLPLLWSYAECTWMTQIHLLGHAPATSILLPSQAAANALRQVTSPQGGRLRAPDATLGAGLFRSPKASCGPPWPGGLLPCSARASPPPPAALRVPPPALRPSPHLGGGSPRGHVSEKPAVLPPSIGSVTYIWDALPLNCQSHYCDQVNVANLYIYCLGK